MIKGREEEGKGGGGGKERSFKANGGERGDLLLLQANQFHSQN